MKKFSNVGQPATIKPIGIINASLIVREMPNKMKEYIPIEAISSLPALYNKDNICKFPKLRSQKSAGYSGGFYNHGEDRDCVDFETIVFSPNNSLSNSGFLLINGKK